MMLSLRNTFPFGLSVVAVRSGMMPESTRNRDAERPIGSSYGVGELNERCNSLEINEAQVFQSFVVWKTCRVLASQLIFRSLRK
jgi:hypothetical protein